MPHAALPPLRIMVVEDEAPLGALFGEVLEGLGFVVCAIEATEAAAVAAAGRNRPDVMLVDIELGGGSGFAAVEKILRIGFVPHVFYSGDVSYVQAMHPNSVAIQKPFRASELLQAIDRALGALAQTGQCESTAHASSLPASRAPPSNRQNDVAIAVPDSGSAPSPLPR